MTKEDVEKIAMVIINGAQPVAVVNGTGGMPMLKLSDHYPRLVRECIRAAMLNFIDEAAKNVLSATTPADAAAKVRATLTWE